MMDGIRVAASYTYGQPHKFLFFPAIILKDAPNSLAI